MLKSLNFRKCLYSLQNKLIYNSSTPNYFINHDKFCSYVSCYKESDPAPYFFSKQVQSLLKKLTGMDLNKVFKNRSVENPEITEEFKFFTKEDLEEYMNKSIEEAKHLLQMPPIVKPRLPIDEVISREPALKNPKITSKLIVTDISPGVTDRSRIIVVREPDGTLRQATWEERDRMNQIYNPRNSRYLEAPPIFKEENLEGVLERGDYLFLLTFAAAQFEADDENFHRVTERTFEHVRRHSSFESLRSTRFFGPMCFYYAWTKKIDDPVNFYLENGDIETAADLVQLHYLIHDKEKATKVTERAPDDSAFVKKYIEEDAYQKSKLSRTFQVFEESRNRNRQSEDLVSHGLT